MAESETRPYRLCESCKQVDDHPRHRLATAPGDGRTPADVMSAALKEASEAGYDLTALLEQAQDDAVLDKHFDCCAADGCNLCQETLDSLPEKSRHGLALAKANAPKDSD
jgi:hypothetical protein